MSNSLRPHESQHTRPPCPSPTPGVHSNSCPSIQSVMPSSHLILCWPLLLLPPIPPNIRVFSDESTLHMRWPKYCSFSFSISLSEDQDWSPLEWTGWISLQSKWLSRVFSKKSINSSAFSFLHSPTLTSIHDHWKNPWSPRDSQESSPTPQFKSINSSVLSFLYSPTLTSIHEHW